MSKYADFQDCPELERLLRTREVHRPDGTTLPVGAGLSTDNNLRTLRRLLGEIRPERTLEVGTAYGASCLAFASHHGGLNPRPGEARHIAIDPYQAELWNDLGLHALERAGLRDLVDFRREVSCLALPALVREGCRVDFSYIDGSHVFEDVFVDFYYINRLTRRQGWIAFDDCAGPHVRKVIRFILTNMRELYEEIDLGPYRGDQGKSWRYRIGRWTDRLQLRVFRKRSDEIQRPYDVPLTAF